MVEERILLEKKVLYYERMASHNPLNSSEMFDKKREYNFKGCRFSCDEPVSVIDNVAYAVHNRLNGYEVFASIPEVVERLNPIRRNAYLGNLQFYIPKI